jgi:hypothetical protein
MPERGTVRRIVTHTPPITLANRQVVLFGSRAHGTAKPRSDFDIGVCGASVMPYDDFYSLADQIELLPTLYRIARPQAGEGQGAKALLIVTV